MCASRIKVLFFAEAVTLAHVARPSALARALDPERFETVIACDKRYASFLAEGPWRHVEIWSIPSTQFVDALARGAPVYDEPTLARYVRDDLTLIEELKPDLIVGDFRLSLSISARLAGIPYLAITNAYWTPAYAGGFPMPALPMTAWLPIPIASALFSMGRPVAMAMHCRPLNSLRRKNGLPSLGHDIRRVYTDADHVLCADAYELIAPGNLPENYTHLGPLPWSPPVTAPEWWESIPTDKPVIYATLGSSGSARLLDFVFSALDGLPLTCVASTAGASLPTDAPANVRVARYLDGDAASRRADLVICNGGSPTTQQALSAGVPVLGLASNMDQMLNMESLRDRGAGELLRADRATVDAIRAQAKRLAGSREHHRAAQLIASTIAKQNGTATIFNSVCARLLAT